MRAHYANTFVALPCPCRVRMRLPITLFIYNTHCNLPPPTSSCLTPPSLAYACVQVRAECERRVKSKNKRGKKVQFVFVSHLRRAATGRQDRHRTWSVCLRVCVHAWGLEGGEGRKKTGPIDATTSPSLPPLPLPPSAHSLLSLPLPLPCLLLPHFH